MFNSHIIRQANSAQAGALIAQPSTNQPRLSAHASDGKDAIAQQDGVSSGAERMHRKRLHDKMALQAESEPWQPHQAKRQKRASVDASLPVPEDAAASIDRQDCARKIQHAFRQYRARNANKLELKAYLHAVMEKVNSAIDYSSSAIMNNQEPSDLAPFDYRIQVSGNGGRFVHASAAEKNQAQFCTLNTFSFRAYAENQVAPNGNNSRVLERHAFLARQGYGNCIEQAVYAQSIILRDLDSRHPITYEPGSDALWDTSICRLLEGDHAFVVLGDHKDNHSLVVDPWAKYVNTRVRGKHTDLTVRHADKTRGFLGPMAQFKDFMLTNRELFDLPQDSGDKGLSIGRIAPKDANRVKPAQYAAIADAIEARARDGDRTLAHQRDKKLFKKYAYMTVYRAS